MPQTTIKEIKDADSQHKPGGASQYAEDAIQRAELYEDRAKALTRRHLKILGQGDADQHEPVTTGGNILARIIEELAVLYRSPVTRRLVVDGLELGDDHPDQQRVDDLLELDQYNLGWQVADELRCLHRNVALFFAEGLHGVTMRIFEPFSLFRSPNANLGADTLAADSALALQVAGSDAGDDRDNRYQLWENWGTPRAPDWRMFLVDEGSQLVEGSPYGEDGATPFFDADGHRVLPGLMIYDEFPRGRAYLPSPESRVSSALAVNATLNDQSYIQKHQAHSQIVSEGDDQRGIPQEHGPGRVWSVPAEHRIYPLNLDPHLTEISATLDQHLRLWASSEGLVADRFLLSRNIPASAAAAKVLDGPIRTRRNRQALLSQGLERVAFRCFRAVHNAFADEWGQPKIRDDAELKIEITRQDQTMEPREYQEVAFRDMAIGALDVVEYVQKSRGINRAEAIRYLERARETNAAYPLNQNPASMVQGPAPAGVDDSKTPGEFHPEISASVEGNSTTEAVKNALEVPGANA